MYALLFIYVCTFFFFFFLFSFFLFNKGTLKHNMWYTANNNNKQINIVNMGFSCGLLTEKAV